MDAGTLLEILRSRGITLAISGANLTVDHNGELTDEDRQLIRDHKADLLAELSESSATEQAAPAPGPDDRSSCPYPWVTPERLEVAAKGERRRRRGEAQPLCWLPEETRQERAAIMEFDGGLTREEAERAAGLTAPEERTP
jgi:hypothetical protein